MNEQKKVILGIFTRYFLVILSALFNLGIFYVIFTPLTIYPVYWIMNTFFEASLLGNIILINKNIPIELIESCIAGSAYFLLFILNMSIPHIRIEKRFRMIFFSFLSLLALNILRIVILIFVYMYGTSYFDVTHKVFWLALSTLFVVGIWFAEVKICKIKSVPLYSDIKYLIDSIKKTKKPKKAKRSKKH